MEIGRLVANAKAASGRSFRLLAERADIAGSTITRIQSGAIDPSVNTLERILVAAGFERRIGALRSGAGPECWIGDLAGAWTNRNDDVRLDWARWRAMLDLLAPHPAWIPEAIYIPPPPAGEDVVDALLAAVAEKLADDAGWPRPSWTTVAPILDVAYRPPVGRAKRDQDIPEQLQRRGLMIDAESLWRNRETIGV